MILFYKVRQSFAVSTFPFFCIVLAMFLNMRCRLVPFWRTSDAVPSGALLTRFRLAGF